MLVENPLYIALKRIQTRPLRILSLIAAEIILIGIVYFVIWVNHQPLKGMNVHISKLIGKNFAIAMLVIQYIVLVIYGTFSIETRIVRDRMSDIINFHRLTPLSPQNIISGYIFGQSSDAIIIWGISFLAGIIGVLSGGISFYQYFSSSILICMCAAFFYLLATWSGLTKSLTLKFGARQTWGFATVLTFLAVNPILINLSPIPAIRTIINDQSNFYPNTYTAFVYFYGSPIPTIFYTMMLWITFGTIAFFSSKRKIFSEDSPALSKKEVLWLYGVLAFFITGRFYGFYTHGLLTDCSSSAFIETRLPLGNSFSIFTAFILLIFSIPRRINLRRYFIKLQMKEHVMWHHDDAPSLTTVKFLTIICVSFQITMLLLIVFHFSRIREITIPYIDIFLQIIFFSISMFFIMFLIEGFRMRFAKNSGNIPALILFIWFFVVPLISSVYAYDRHIKNFYLAWLSPTKFLIPVFLRDLSEKTSLPCIITGLLLLVIATYLSFLFWQKSKKIFQQKLFEIKD